MVDTDNEPDLLRRVSVVEILDQQIEDAEEEVASLSGSGWKSPYPNLCILTMVLTALSRDYDDRLQDFFSEEMKLNKIYGVPEDREYILTNKEAEERLRNVLILDKEVGHGKIDEEFAYYQAQQPDSIDFADWGEDK